MTFRTTRRGGHFQGWRRYPCLKERTYSGPVLGDLESHEAAKRFMESLPPEAEYVVSLVREKGKIVAMRLLVSDPDNQRMGISSWSKGEGYSFKVVPLESPASIN
jgi:hypothetical protein